ncbi:MAG TPA: molybdate ABC transporter substrate-binding protein [Acidimicrobiia bacterium]|nr:molybdate ABC transporter substrate-binding protein [Acidimicrobiia bacterium]
MNRRNPRSVALRPWAALFVALTLFGAACGTDDKSKVSADKTSTTTAPASSTTSSTDAPTTTTGAAASSTTTAQAGTVTPKSSATTVTTAAPTTTTTAPKVAGDITVLAAASLTDSFTEMGKAFEAANPGSHVKFSFDSSSTLAGQANNGAPADVFASADDANMKKATDGGSAQDPKPFTRNRMAIVVGKGNPKGVASVKDSERVTWVRCADGVPCGDYAKQILGAAKVDTGAHPPKSLETNVKGVVTKVTSGSVDAGIVYVTDGKAASSTSETIDIPDDVNVIANYPIARLKQSGHADVANAFIAFVLSAPGQSILLKYGFLPLS